MTVISNFVAMSKNIIRIDLSNSRLDENGIKMLCEALNVKNRSLKDLSLKRVGLSVPGLYRVCEMIAVNTSIERLSLGEDGKKFNFPNIKNLVIAISANKTLKFVELYMMCN